MLSFEKDVSFVKHFLTSEVQRTETSTEIFTMAPIALLGLYLLSIKCCCPKPAKYWITIF